MPRYDYACPLAHVTEHIFRITEKPDTVACPTCQEEAHPVPSLVAGFIGISNTRTPKDPPRNDGQRMLTWCDGICRTCANTTTLFYDATGKTEPHACEHCGGTDFEERAAVGVPSSVRYPHYNRGLGCVITSPGHMKRVMREQGVTDADPQDIINAMEREQSRRHEEAARQQAANARMLGTNSARATLNSQWYKDQVQEAISSALKDAPSPMEVALSQLQGSL